MMTPLNAARMCAQAYDHIDQQFGEAKFLESEGCGFYIAAFQGSDDARQWMADLDAIPIYSERLFATVHKGFRDLAEPCFSYLKAKADTGKKISLVGHSLGAALALYLTGALSEASYCGVEMIGFGCPIIGNAEQVARAVKTANVTLFRHGEDIVPTIPPFLDWSNPNVKELPAYPSLGMLEDIKDHSIGLYIRALGG